MIPKKIQPYFEILTKTKKSSNNIIQGRLRCCNAHEFEVLAVGNIKYSLFSKMCLYPENDKIVLEVRCKKCGKVISVFNSSFDGYGQAGKKPQNICASTQCVDCIKCRNNSFSVAVKYEYLDDPEQQELRELGISDIDNTFTWIWITLKCNKCGTRYKNFVDWETA